jgi:hypothetical protein
VGVTQPGPVAGSALASRSTLAALLATAGVIHVAMVPSHWQGWPLEGLGFALAGWAQLGLAAVVARELVRPVLLGIGVLNVALVGAWLVTRTAGSPWGPHAGHAESIGAVDGAVVAVQLVAVALVGTLLVRPQLDLGRLGPPRLVVMGIPVLMAVLATVVLASPSARDHSHSAHGGHESGDDHADDSHEPGDDHGHDDDGGADVDAAGHAHQAVAADADADDLGLALLDNGHQHGSGEVELDLQTELRLHAQLAVTLELVELYPTVADAEAAGFRRAGPFSPGLGTHYMPPGSMVAGDGLLDDEALRWPMLIFDGWEDDAPLAGFMYLAGAPDRDPPEGFVGPNDHWHYHTDVCMVVGPDGIDAPLGADHSATQEQCDRYGGFLLDRTPYMVHVWTVPGYESSRGVFSEINPAITCPDGTYHMKPMDELGLSPTLCHDDRPRG